MSADRWNTWTRLAGSLSFAAAVTIVAAQAQAADYRESFDDTADPTQVMAGVLLLGEKDGWSGTLGDGAYTLSNPDTANSVRYYFLNPKGQPGSLSVSVDGRFDGKNAGAGLIYGIDRSAGTYYAFVISNEGRYTVFKRTAQGLQRIAAGGNEAIRREGPNTLSVEFEGNAVHHFVNDSKMMGFGSGAPVRGGVGIVALDVGSYSFDDFVIDMP